MAEKQKSHSGYMKKLLIWGLIGLFFVLLFSFVFSPNPAPPEIKYGEFPFKLTYVINGETKIIEDVIVCEFDGYESHGEAGKIRKWTAHLKSGSKRITLLQVGESTELYCFYEAPEYYMDDLVGMSKEEYEKWFTDGLSWRFVRYTEWKSDGSTDGHYENTDELCEKYGITIIGWEPSEPIVNTYYGE